MAQPIIFEAIIIVVDPAWRGASGEPKGYTTRDGILDVARRATCWRDTTLHAMPEHSSAREASPEAHDVTPCDDVEMTADGPPPTPMWDGSHAPLLIS